MLKHLLVHNITIKKSIQGLILWLTQLLIKTYLRMVKNMKHKLKKLQICFFLSEDSQISTVFDVIFFI